MTPDTLALLDTLDGLRAAWLRSEPVPWHLKMDGAYPRLAAALRTALTPTTNGEREAREAASGDLCGDLLGTYYDAPECDLPAGHGGPHAHGMEGMVSVAHIRTALNLLAIERAKAADAARERDELRAALRLIRSNAGPHDNWSDEEREGWARADAIERGAYNKVTP